MNFEVYVFQQLFKNKIKQLLKNKIIIGYFCQNEKDPIPVSN